MPCQIFITKYLPRPRRKKSTEQLQPNRGWRGLSTAGSSYNADYFGDTSKLPAAMRKERDIKDGENYDETINIFRLDNGKVRHFWGSELTWAAMDPGQHHRSGDAVNALWGLLDMTPEGREQFMPKLAY